MIYLMLIAFWDMPIPEEFQIPYPGPVIERNYTWDQIKDICGPNTYACSNTVADYCVMFLPLEGRGGVAPRTMELIHQHEEAHCVAHVLGKRWIHKHMGEYNVTHRTSVLLEALQLHSRRMHVQENKDTSTRPHP